MKKKTFLTSLLTIAMCLALIAGSTYALFTSEDEINIAVTSGQVKVTATVGELATYSMGEATDVNGVFENGGTAVLNQETATDMLTLTNITPGDKVTFKIDLVNESNVTIQYRLVWTVDGELSNELVAKAGATLESATTLVNNKTKWTTWDIPTDETKTQTVWVSIELPTECTLQGESASISFKIEAVQGNAEVIDDGNFPTNNNISWTLTEAGETLAISGNGTISAADIQSLSEYTSQITNVKIGSSITEIGEEAFRGLNISTVTFEDNSNLSKIGTNAFRDCAALETINIPASVETISEKAFQSCTSLESLTFDANSQLKTVGDGKNAFAYCTSLKSVVLPDSVETIGVACFYGCTNLETVVLGDNVSSIGISAFEKSGLTAFEVPAALTVIPNGMLNNTKITTITVGDQVTTVNPGAFANCTELKTAYIGSATVKASVFDGCSNLETVIFANVTDLDGWAFMNCTNLKTVVINAENNLTLGYNTYTTGERANWFGNTYYSATGNVITYIASAIDGVYSEQCENCLLGHGWNDGTADGTDILAYTNGGTFANGTTFVDGTLATPTKAGYVFGGWYTESDFSGTAVTTAEAGQIYYAKWIAE